MVKAKFFILLICFLFAFTGCATVSTTGMLEYDPAKKDLKIDNVKFSIIKNNVNITNRAVEYYPNIFLDDYKSLPINLRLNCKTKHIQHDEGAILYGLTLGLLPAPLDSDENFCSGGLEISNIDGPIVQKDINYSFDKMRWVPGIPFLLFAPFVHSRKDFATMEEQTLIEYAVKSISESNLATLKDAYEYRKNRLQKVNIYGNEYWVFIGLIASARSESNKKNFDVAVANFWKEYPKILSEPLESVVIAKRDEKEWQAVNSVIRKLGFKKLTMVSGKIINNRPIAIEIREDIVPKVEYFVNLTNYNDIEEIRWSNNKLLEAKNLTFSEDLKEKRIEEILWLLTELEKEMLNLNERLSRLELSLQQKLINKQDTSYENMLIPLYQQRINIFESLITTTKQSLKRI